jgi:hypothetical protein
MKVIDFHVHIGQKGDWLPQVFDLMLKANPALNEHFEKIMCPAGLEAILRKEGVDGAVVLAENSPTTTGVVTNEFVADFCSGRKFFIPFCSVHPASEGKVEELVHCVEDLNIKGVKMYPSYQHFYPNDPSMYPFYGKAQELGVPIMFHTGSSVFKGARLKYSEPKYLDDIAVDFPDLRIVMAHSGRGAWYDEAFLLAIIHPNIFMEVSGLPPKNLLKYFPELRKVTGKVIFGSDWPTISDIRGNIEAIRGLGLPSEAVEAILGGNALKVLGKDI